MAKQMASERIEIVGKVAEVCRWDRPGVYIGEPPEVYQLMVSLPGLSELLPVEVQDSLHGRLGEFFDRARVRLVIELPEGE